MLMVTTSGISHSETFEVAMGAVADPERVMRSSSRVLLPLLGHSTVSWQLFPQRPHFFPWHEFL